jgi:putative ATP-binding cassette transporter
MRFLFQSSRRIVVVSTIAGAASGAMGVALIALIQSELSRQTPASGAVAWAFAGLCAVAALARIIAQVSLVRLGQDAVAKLNTHLVRRVLDLPLQAFEAIDASALLAVLTEDIVLIAGAMAGVPQLCINVPIVIACLVYIGWLAPLVFVCGLVFLALAVTAYMLLSAQGVKRLRAARAGQDVLVGHFRTLIGGFRELKLHAGRRSAFFSESLVPATQSVRDKTVAGLARFAAAEGWSQLAFFGFIGFLLFVAPRLQPIPRPTLAALVLVVLYLMSPLDVVLTWLPILGRARASLQKVHALIPRLERHEFVDHRDEGPSRELVFRDSIELEHASFHYPGDEQSAGFRLGPIDLVLRPGELVILAGGNGSGKTTLVKLISGLYRPRDGTLRVDGRVLREQDAEAYRQLFSVVFADGYLLPDLAGLDSRGLEQKVRHGLDRLGLASRVTLSGRAFSTTGLSSGQKRRLALLSACLEDRPVCIFDEWAANQDRRFKQMYYHELLPELKAQGKALLIISHDEDYFEIADRVIRLHEGRLHMESVATPIGT